MDGISGTVPMVCGPKKKRMETPKCIVLYIQAVCGGRGVTTRGVPPYFFSSAQVTCDHRPPQNNEQPTHHVEKMPHRSGHTDVFFVFPGSVIRCFFG